jgi:CMP-N-acetylneuraminic acid synthetase
MTDVKKVVALLPMKGNSERIPGKNLKNFAGKPLFHAVMQTLEDCELVSKIIINTDSKEIADSATNNFNKVKIHWRPEEICGDFVSMNKVIVHDLVNSEEEHFLQTHCTNPLLSLKTLNEAISTYFKNLEKKHDSLFSVNKWLTRLYWEDMKPVNHNPRELLRTQDLPPLFEENSNFYIFSKDAFKKANEKRIGLNPIMYPTPKMESVDVDFPEDFELAEFIYKKQKGI